MLLGKFQEKRPSGRPKCKCEDNIEDRSEMGSLSQDQAQSCTLQGERNQHVLRTVVARANNEWSCTPPPQYVCMVWCSVKKKKHRGNFTFTHFV